MRTFFEHEGAVRDVAFSGDGTCVVSGGDDGKVNVWDARSHGLIQHYASHAGPITSIAMEPRAGHYLASSGDDGTYERNVSRSSVSSSTVMTRCASMFVSLCIGPSVTHVWEQTARRWVRNDTRYRKRPAPSLQK